LTDDLVIAPVEKGSYSDLLPLIADYQRFYGVATPDDEKNRAFFVRFLGTSEAGSILGARSGDRFVGYACLYFSPSSVEAEDIVIMNDLYVVPEARGAGVGRQLIEATTTVARDRGVRLVRWSTALDNRRAQRLYETTGAERSTWFEYEISVGRSDR
jgi:GNAT superfamily N-acetyltransferase